MDNSSLQILNAESLLQIPKDIPFSSFLLNLIFLFFNNSVIDENQIDLILMNHGVPLFIRIINLFGDFFLWNKDEDYNSWLDEVEPREEDDKISISKVGSAFEFAEINFENKNNSNLSYVILIIGDGKTVQTPEEFTLTFFNQLISYDMKMSYPLQNFIEEKKIRK